jgi:hypothetical protein
VFELRRQVLPLRLHVQCFGATIVAVRTSITSSFHLHLVFPDIRYLWHERTAQVLVSPMLSQRFKKTAPKVSGR